jgi:hypothetical protein
VHVLIVALIAAGMFIGVLILIVRAVVADARGDERRQWRPGRRVRERVAAVAPRQK